MSEPRIEILTDQGWRDISDAGQSISIEPKDPDQAQMDYQPQGTIELILTDLRYGIQTASGTWLMVRHFKG